MPKRRSIGNEPSQKFVPIFNKVDLETKATPSPSQRKRGKKRPKIEIADPDCYAMMMCGISVNLPKGLTPYPTQKLMMVRILTALLKGQNALAESPTGSGKTMALLASSCAWLVDYKERRQERFKLCERHGDGTQESSNMTSEKSIDSSDVKVPLPGGFDELIHGLDDDFVPPAEVSFSTKFIDLVNDDMTACEEKEVMEGEARMPVKECTCLPRVRIYYGTRTHKQIGQVVKEFSRLPYFGRLNHTILGSREQMCINPGAKEAADPTAKCKELIGFGGIGCDFKKNMRNYERGYVMRHFVNERRLSNAWDIEELVSVLGEADMPMCPYFSATRVLTEDSDIVFCPFPYLIDPIIRTSSDVHLKDAVVILDEAHNVEDTCRESASFSFTDREIEDSINSLEDKTIKAATLLKDPKIMSEDAKIGKIMEREKNLGCLLNFCRNMLHWLKEISEKVPSPTDRYGKGTATLSWELLKLSLDDEKTHDRQMLFKEKDDKEKKEKKEDRMVQIRDALGAVLSRGNRSDDNESSHGGDPLDELKPSSTAIVCIEKFLFFATYFKVESRSCFRLNIVVDQPQDNGRYTGTSGGPKNAQYMSSWTDSEGMLDARSQAHRRLRPGYRVTANIWCMSPELAFMDAFRTCRSVVLASGTLCPTETLRTELGMNFSLQMEGDQVIPRDQIFASVTRVGPRGHRMVATFKNVNDNDVFVEELSEIIKKICETVPSGILCFLPSYRLLDRLHSYMDQKGKLRQIEMRKVVVVEPRRSSELNKAMEKYEKAITDPRSCGAAVDGALFLAVFRGKVSEGIDFADDRARCVISVGIPFPNVMDELVKEKKKYNDMNSKTLNILTGDQWYISQAYRALNQALGRCLRHRDDWGAIVMVEDRLASQHTSPSSARVSKWIRDTMVVHDNFNHFTRDLESFINRRTNQKPIIKSEPPDIL